MKWHRGTLDVVRSWPLHKAGRREPIDGWLCDGVPFGVHLGQYKGWRITHLQSGGWIGPEWETRAKAQAVAERYARLPGWDRIRTLKRTAALTRLEPEVNRIRREFMDT